MKFNRFLSFSLFSLPFLLTPPQLRGEFLENFTKGHDAIQRGDLNDGEKFLLESHRENPLFRKTLYWLGKLYREKGDLTTALFYHQKGMDLESFSAWRKKQYQQETLENDFNRESLEELENLLEKAKVHRERGETYLSQGQLKPALIEFKNSYLLNPAHFSTGLQLARLQADFGEEKGSLQTLESLIEKFPEDPQLQKELAQRYEKLGVPSRAMEILRRTQSPELQNLKERLKHQIPKPNPGRGKIIKRDGNRVILNLGLKGGLHPTDEFTLKFSIYRPETLTSEINLKGKISEVIHLHKIGECLITRLYDDHCEALLTSEFDLKIVENDIIN